jgi:hypothetical protein
MNCSPQNVASFYLYMAMRYFSGSFVGDIFRHPPSCYIYTLHATFKALHVHATYMRYIYMLYIHTTIIHTTIIHTTYTRYIYTQLINDTYTRNAYTL